MMGFIVHGEPTKLSVLWKAIPSIGEREDADAMLMAMCDHDWDKAYSWSIAMVDRAELLGNDGGTFDLSEIDSQTIRFTTNGNVKVIVQLLEDERLRITVDFGRDSTQLAAQMLCHLYLSDSILSVTRFLDAVNYHGDDFFEFN